MEQLIGRLRGREAVAAVIGLGYVGLPLAVEIARAGFRTIGVEANADRVQQLNAGRNYLADLDNRVVADLVSSGRLRATTDYAALADVDTISICVPTPLGKGKIPDLSCIVSAVEQIRTHLRPHQLIVLESTTYPGTTDEAVLPMLEAGGLKAGHDFFLAFSPERIDPGNARFGVRNTPKIIGGVTPSCTEMALCFYRAFIEHVIPVSSPRVAEMVKLLENTFRAINVGLANEVAIMCGHLGVDTWEVIDAAATKPFGFMPFYPGPGLGGHCIPVDPHYLVWKLRSMNYNPRFIQLADEINSTMPALVVEKIAGALNVRAKPVHGSRVLVLGVAYKANVDDYRESPALDVIHLLRQRGAQVEYADPHVPAIAWDGMAMEAVALNGQVHQYDCVVVLTNHTAFDMRAIVREAQVVVDTRNATRGLHEYADKIIKI